MTGIWYGILSGCLKPEKKKNGGDIVKRSILLYHEKTLLLILSFSKNLEMSWKRIMTLIELILDCVGIEVFPL